MLFLSNYQITFFMRISFIQLKSFYFFTMANACIIYYKIFLQCAACTSIYTYRKVS